MKTILIILLTAAASIAGTWLVLKPGSHGASPPSGHGSAPGRILYYQSAMHPWIKSEKPGRCTICGMELTPIREGEEGMENSADANLVSLSPSQVQVLHPGTTLVENRPLTRELRFAGTIVNDNTRRASISAYTDSRVDKLHVNYVGAEVRAGQPLAEIYSPAILQATREYRQLQGELRDKAALRLRQLGLTEDQIRSLSSRPADSLTTEILAPLGGTVISQNIREGEYATTGQTLFEIADFSTMWLLFDAYEYELTWIHPGQDLTVTTASLPGREFPGKVDFIDPVIQATTRAAKVRVVLENPADEAGRRPLLSGLYAEARLTVTSETPVLVVSRSAILQTGTRSVAYIDHGAGMYEQREVTLGRQGSEEVEVLAGLHEGDRVVTQGALLIDGQAEINRAFALPADTPVLVTAGTGLKPEQKKIMGEFLNTVDAMGTALADDDLKKFNEVSEPAMNLTAAFLKTAKALDAEGRIPKEKWDQLDESRHFHGFEDIQKARVAFHKFSMAAVALIDALHHIAPLPDAKIFQCPMVDEAIPGAPAKSFWLQTGDRELANPYFGAKMLRCGSKVIP